MPHNQYRNPPTSIDVKTIHPSVLQLLALEELQTVLNKHKGRSVPEVDWTTYEHVAWLSPEAKTALLDSLNLFWLNFRPPSEWADEGSNLTGGSGICIVI